MNVYKNDLDETVRFRIEPHIGTEGIYLELKENGKRATTVFPPKDAPTLALAILEAAGVDLNESWSGLDPYGTPSHLGWIGGHLRVYVRQFANDQDKAQEQAELEAEAVELYRASFKARMGRESRVKGLDDIVPNSRKEWLDVARRAREMRNEKKEQTDD